jgi:hypothetical protein
MSTNITTQYSTALSNSTKELTQSVSDLFDFMINKALILCLTIICICILLLIICVVIYKIIKTKKQNFLSATSSSTPIENIDNIIQVDPLSQVSHSTAGKLGFNTLHNTSQINNDNISVGNKDNMSLSELRVQNEKLGDDNVNISSTKNSNSSQGSNDSNEIEVKVKKTKGKKKRKSNNANSNRSNTESSKGEDISTPKDNIDMENELQKQMEIYKNDESL